MPTAPIYLDCNATTRVRPEVFETMRPFLQDQYGNPSSAYRLGSTAARALEQARAQVAGLIGAQAEDVIFTSCGTESANTALHSAISAFPDKRHLVVSAIEHSAILKHAEHLARRGYAVTRVGVDAEGRVQPEAVAAALRDDTAFAAVMWANNETGVISPISEIAAECARRGVLFFSDAVQAAGKVPIDVSRVPGLHYLGLSGHKLHAPKGIGALWVRPGAPFSSLLHGGGQEEGRRAGTENVASGAGFGQACALARGRDLAAVAARRDRLEAALLERLPGASVNGGGERLPNTTNIYLGGVEAGPLLLLFDKAGLCASAGSACSSGSVHPSHVLRAMGCSAERAKGSMRFSLDVFTTDEEIDRAVEIVVRSIDKLKAALAG
ncbi:MAG: aminotransferase class V-fold PLP-dependent enzyme [Verrucomicrobia bacterium]|nr:aminotransferase class V-fold PLP-dependent enzyme [Verrucomicrobiota bacterium]